MDEAFIGRSEGSVSFVINRWVNIHEFKQAEQEKSVFSSVLIKFFFKEKKFMKKMIRHSQYSEKWD